MKKAKKKALVSQWLPTKDERHKHGHTLPSLPLF